MKITVLFFLLTLSHLSYASTKTKIDVLKSLSLTEGEYSTVLDTSIEKPEFCQNENIDIELIDNNGSLTLSLGARLAFPYLESTETVKDSNQKCVLKITNKYAVHQLEQTSVEICGKQKKEQRTHLFKISNGKIDYTYKNGSILQHCQYNLIKGKNI